MARFRKNGKKIYFLDETWVNEGEYVNNTEVILINLMNAIKMQSYILIIFINLRNIFINQHYNQLYSF